MSSFVLKIIACIFMLIDHVGYLLFPRIEWLRVIGRMAMPIFAFQASIGFEKTKNREKYITRMLLFTIVSQIPFYWFNHIVSINHKNELNIGAALTLGLLALYCIDKFKEPIAKIISVLIILLISAVVPMDYGWFCVSLIILFYLLKGQNVILIPSYIFLVTLYCYIQKSLFGFPAILAIIPILLYNNKKGMEAKHIFYWFYPLHLLILAIIKCVLITQGV